MYSAKKQWQRANIATAILVVYITSAAVNGQFTFSDNNTKIQSLDRSGVSKCQDGLLLSVWQPQDDLTLKDIVIRGAVYFSILVYLFIGVSIVSDRFMAAIEVITSKEVNIFVLILQARKAFVDFCWVFHSIHLTRHNFILLSHTHRKRWKCVN